MLGDLEEGRLNLGLMTPVAVYRLMQFSLRDILIRDFGVEKADRASFEAGKRAGHEYSKHIVTDKEDLNLLFADASRAWWRSSLASRARLMRSSVTPSW
jgi:hypothetical protein